MKAATFGIDNANTDKKISIHAAREGGDFAKKELPIDLNISIHAAREGGDVDSVNANHGDIISIHAAREGGDGCKFTVTITKGDFNPRRP